MAYIIPLELLREDVDYQKGSVGIIKGCFVLLTCDTSTLFLRKGFGENDCDCISSEQEFPIENFVNFVDNKAQKGTWFAELGGCYEETKQFYFYKDFNTCTKLCYKIKQTSDIENDERYTNLKNLVVSLEECEPTDTVFEFNNVTDLINMLTCFDNNSVVHIVNVKQNSIIFQDKTLFFKYNYTGRNIKPHSINTRIKIKHLLQFLKYVEKISNKIFMWSLQENSPLFVKSTIKFSPQSPEYLIVAPYVCDHVINTAEEDPDSQNLTASPPRPFLEERLEPETLSFVSDDGATVTVSDSTVSFSALVEEER